MHVGYWTPWNEKWFLTRLRHIRTNEAEPYNARQWRNRLRQSTAARQLRDGLEIASHRWLEDVFRVRTTAL